MTREGRNAHWTLRRMQRKNYRAVVNEIETLAGNVDDVTMARLDVIVQDAESGRLTMNRSEAADVFNRIDELRNA